MLLGLEIAATVVEAAAVGTAARAFIVGSYHVPTASMAPTIHPGDRLIGEKVTLRASAARQGDIVTLKDPRDHRVTLVKRIVATEGNVVDIVDGKVVLDGHSLEEPYTHNKPTRPLSSTSWGDFQGNYPLRIPEGHVWVMGDNRTGSIDSRCFGPVPVDTLTSRVVAIVWPPSHARSIKTQR